MARARRPRVICHMFPSLDGRIVTERWKLPPGALDEYERTARTFGADAWMIGRVSMQPYAGRGRIPAPRSPERLPRTDFIARRDAGSYFIALDPSGKLGWRSASIDGEHVVAVLTEQVPDGYLAHLRAVGVSYLFGGRRRVNLRRVLEKLRAGLGIQTLLLEGGGGINGSFLAADLVDEISVLVAPIADGAVGTPTLFDAGRVVARRLRLVSFERRRGDVLWIRYRVRR